MGHAIGILSPLEVIQILDVGCGCPVFEERKVLELPFFKNREEQLWERKLEFNFGHSNLNIWLKFPSKLIKYVIQTYVV